MCRVKKIFIFCLCVVSSFVFALHSSASYAINLTSDVDLVTRFYTTLNVGILDGSLSCTEGCERITTGITSTAKISPDVQFTIPARNYSAGDYVVIPITIYKIQDSASLHATLNGLHGRGQDSSTDLIDYHVDQLDANTSKVTFYWRFWRDSYYTNIGVYAVGGGAFMNIFQNEWLAVGSSSIWHEKNSTNYSNSINTINNNLNSINSGIDDLKRSQNQANQDANDRYEDEKDTINDNGDNTSGAWSDNSDNLKFDVPTGLFNWFWSLGTTDQCIDISTLASLLHSNETQYCSWYPTSIRSIISPIINIFLVCFISGFIIKWLKKDGI